MTLADKYIADVDIEESVNNKLTTADSFTTTASQVRNSLTTVFNVYQKFYKTWEWFVVACLYLV